MATTDTLPNITQFKNLRTGQYVKYNRSERRFMESSKTKFEGIPLTVVYKKAKRKSTTKRKSTKK